jgi:hypothetical protein
MVPSQNGIGLGNRRHLCQRLLPQLLPQLSKGAAITIRQLHATADLLAQDAILGAQVRIAQPEPFVNRRGN